MSVPVAMRTGVGTTNHNGGALDKGKHVLVEKPISNDIGQAREMVAKATEEDLYLGCNLNHYFTRRLLNKRRNILRTDTSER